MINLVLDKCPCCNTEHVPLDKDQLSTFLFYMSLSDQNITIEGAQIEPTGHAMLISVASKEVKKINATPKPDTPTAPAAPTDDKSPPPIRRPVSLTETNRHWIGDEIEAYLEGAGRTIEGANLGITAQGLRNILSGETRNPTKKTIKKIQSAIKKRAAEVVAVEVKEYPELPDQAPHKPPPPITDPRSNGTFKSLAAASQFFSQAVNAWIEAEGVDPVVAAEILNINQPVLTRIRLDKGGHLPHLNCIDEFAKHIPAIQKRRGALLAARKAA